MFTNCYSSFCALIVVNDAKIIHTFVLEDACGVVDGSFVVQRQRIVHSFDVNDFRWDIKYGI